MNFDGDLLAFVPLALLDILGLYIDVRDAWSRWLLMMLMLTPALVSLTGGDADVDAGSQHHGSVILHHRS